MIPSRNFYSTQFVRSKMAAVKRSAAIFLAEKLQCIPFRSNPSNISSILAAIRIFLNFPQRKINNTLG